MMTTRSMGTLMTAFSGVAAVMCLLVGVQLFYLAAQIGRTADLTTAGDGRMYRQWSAEARTGAVMSLGAGALILLFGIRHHRDRGRSAAPDGPEWAAADLASVSVEVYDVDPLTGRVADPTDAAADAAPRPAPAPLPPVAPGDDPAPVADPTESILRSIREASTAPTTGAPAPADRTGNSLWKKMLRFLGR